MGSTLLSSVCLGHSIILHTVPIHIQRWLATSDSDDEDGSPPMAFDQDPMDINSEYGYTMSEHGRYFPTEPHHAPQGSRVPVLKEKPLGRGEPLEEELASFASKYLNFDYEPSTPVDYMISTETGSPSISTSATSITEGIEAVWEIQPPFPSLEDTDLGFEVDANGVTTRDYTYQLSHPPQYFDEEDYAREYELARIKAKLGARPTGRFAGKAIYRIKEGKVKKRKQRGGEKAKEVGMGISPPLVNFSRAIRGRTIYKP